MKLSLMSWFSGSSRANQIAAAKAKKEEKELAVQRSINDEILNFFKGGNTQACQDIFEKIVLTGTEENSEKWLIPFFVETLLKDKDPHIRQMSVSALYNLKDKDTVPALIEALKDNDKDIVRETISALGNLGHEAKNAVPALIEVYLNRDPGLGYNAIAKIGKAAVPHIVNVFEQSTNSDERIKLIELLGLMGMHSVRELNTIFQERRSRSAYEGKEAAYRLLENATVNPHYLIRLVEEIENPKN